MRKKNWLRVLHNFYLDAFIHSFTYNSNHYSPLLSNGENIDCIETAQLFRHLIDLGLSGTGHVKWDREQGTLFMVQDHHPKLAWHAYVN